MANELDLTTVEKMANMLIDGHLTADWSFSWNRRSSSFGLCKFSIKTIELSAPLTRHSTVEKVVQTIKHEIAHAIVGPDFHPRTGRARPHGAKWQAMMRKLGADPSRTSSFTAEQVENVVKSSAPHWQMVDTTTGKVLKRYKRRPSYKTFQTIDAYYVRGRKAATKGKLKLVLSE